MSLFRPQGRKASCGIGADYSSPFFCLRIASTTRTKDAKEAKDFVEAVAAGPKTVKEGLSKEDADKLAAQFKEVGGECEIK